MSFVVIECEQRSEQWLAARLGRLTGTGAPKMLAEGRGKAESKQRAELRVNLALERLTGLVMDSATQTDDMRRGVEMEPLALAAYETYTGRAVMSSGFLAHPTLQAGCSLDGYVGDMEGIVEFKCPRPHNHWEYLSTSEIPLDYRRQITHNLWISGAQWADFVSFDPRWPEGARLRIIRLTLTPEELKAYELAARLFLGEVDKQVEDIRALLTKGVAAVA